MRVSGKCWKVFWASIRALKHSNPTSESEWSIYLIILIFRFRLRVVFSLKNWTRLALLTFTQRIIHAQKQSKNGKIELKQSTAVANTIGQLIVVERKRMGLTQEELAQQAGIRRQWLGRWERGRALPTLENLEKIRRILNFLPVVSF